MDLEEKNTNFDERLFTRGGLIYLECPDHLKAIDYCICENPIGDPNMVACDYCDYWMHYSCVDYAPSNILF
jgi:hypothetical protein